MKHHMLALQVVAITMVLGCGVKMELPEHSDTLTSLTTANPAYNDLTLGLILSDNTKNAIQHTKEFLRDRPGHDTAISCSKLFDNITSVFQDNFKEVYEIEKPRQANMANVDLIAVLDV